MRRSPNSVGLGVLFVVLLVLHFSLRPLLAWKPAIDFLVIGVVLVSVRIRPGPAALVGLTAGVIADALAPSSFGAAALAMTAVAFGASWLKSSFFAEHVLLNALFLFAAKIAFDFVFLLAERRVSFGGLFFELGRWSSLSALITAVAGLALLVLFRPLIIADGDRG